MFADGKRLELVRKATRGSPGFEDMTLYKMHAAAQVI
jgi:hypothetical protein